MDPRFQRDKNLSWLCSCCLDDTATDVGFCNRRPGAGFHQVVRHGHALAPKIGRDDFADGCCADISRHQIMCPRALYRGVGLGVTNVVHADLRAKVSTLGLVSSSPSGRVIVLENDFTAGTNACWSRSGSKSTASIALGASGKPHRQDGRIVVRDDFCSPLIDSRAWCQLP